MNVPRRSHKTILLDNGQVLAVTDDATGANTAELYNPATGTWTLTGTPAVFHEGGSVTLLANGDVLLAGGTDGSGTAGFTAAAELYNPSTGQWSTTGSMASARNNQAAVLLPNGEVLVAGGWDSSLSSIASAELYNPATGTWQPTASMHASRYRPVAELLGDGTVLVAGGAALTNGVGSSLTSAEIYNPSTGEWTSIANFPLATFPGGPPLGVGASLPNGGVLVAREAFFDPGTGTWTATAPIPFSSTRIGCSTATLLTTGNVLLTGFRSTYNRTPPVNTALVYDASSNTYPLGASMTTPRWANAATLLPNGQVLVSGGFGYTGVVLSSAELYTP
jgi:hypothetical protein